MATTATLNGGPTGGLHATPTLIHTDNNPPQSETCRVDSNSSFESGHEDQLQSRSGNDNVVGAAARAIGEIPEQNHNSWIASNDASSKFYIDDPERGYNSSEASSKKRRKQSRPVRIPASEDSSGLPMPTNVSPTEEGKVQGKSRKTPQLSSRSHVPLNLSSRLENSSSEDENSPHQNRSSSDHKNSFGIENDKTELLAGQGTKDSPRGIATSDSPSLPPSFSPGLFPLSANSPFSSLFSANLNLFSQQHQQHQLSLTGGQQTHHQGSNPAPAGTPTSSSSNSTNSGVGMAITHGHILSSLGVNCASGSGGNPNLVNNPQQRIFNQEAYCDLCHKEFCNKYFLKTHKANKHGVYTEMSPSLAIGPGTSNNTSFLTNAPLHSSTGLAADCTSSNGGDGSLQQYHHQQQQQQHTNPSGSGTGSIAISNTGTMSKGAATTGGISSEIPFSLAAFSLEKATGCSNGSQQCESFCELCQKKFCNKYFLKRHKTKIHGIPVDSSSTGSGRSSSSSNHGKSTTPHNRNQFSSNGLGDGVKLKEGLSLRDIGLETLGLEMVTKHLENNSGREEGELSANEESNTERRAKSPENQGEFDDNSSSFKMLKLPALMAASGENNCQFCFREFSSKQLLYNHLIKKHRLSIPSTFPPFLLPFPSGLFDADGGESGSQNQQQFLDSNGNATNSLESDYECNLCNRSFQTVYLLRMHKSYFHPESEEAADSSKYISEAASRFLVKPTELTDDDGDNDNLEDGDGHGEGSDEADSVSRNNTPPMLPSKEEEGDTDNIENCENPRGKTAKDLEIENRGEATSDSDDLRRLQTMLMELSRVHHGSTAVAWSPPLGESGANTTSNSPTNCQICNKEFYSTYFLQQHIQHYHSSTQQGTSAVDPGLSIQTRIKSESPSAVGGRSESPNRLGDTIRIKTEEEFGVTGGGGKRPCLSERNLSISQETLKERLLHPESFGLGDSSLGVNLSSSTFLTPSPKGLSGQNNNNNTISIKSEPSGAKRPSPSLSRSYCTICHKELCNKYFMRTHMLKMHGISIESSTGLGGVTCDICNKELCSKYFLKVHKQNTHGIVEDGPSPPNPSTPGPISLSSVNFPLSSLTGLNLSSSSPHSDSGISPSGGSASTAPTSNQIDSSSIPLLPKEASDLQNRYFCHYSEVCPFCGRRFRSPKWLKTHLQSDHGEEGRERWKSIEKTLHLTRRQGQNIMSQSQSQSGHKSPRSSKDFSLGHRSTSGGGGGSSNSGKSGKTPTLTRDGNKCAFCSFSSNDVENMKNHLIKEHSSQLANRQQFHQEGYSDIGGNSPGGSAGVIMDPLTLLFQKMEGGSNKLYRCTYCPFTTSILVYLYAHERNHTGLGGGSQLIQQMGISSDPTFQCPMCFHTFEQPEAFQQHLIGHQMSGVLAPFFTPTTSASSHVTGRMGFLSSPTGSTTEESSSDPRSTLLSLPVLNGNTSESLYWALKNPATALAMTGKSNGDENKTNQDENENEPAADLTMTGTKRKSSADNFGQRKREKVSRFRCSYCQERFLTRDLCLAHIRLTHGSKHKSSSLQTSQTQSDLFMSHQGESGTIVDINRRRKGFRCRKCRFKSTTYQMLVVHSKLHHGALRPMALLKPKTISTGTLTIGSGSEWKVGGKCGNLPEGIPQEGKGTVDGDGSFLMQGFMLSHSNEESTATTTTSSTEHQESDTEQKNVFVPSVVYLPVREKVSQSIRVSFSLTPTT